MVLFESLSTVYYPHPFQYFQIPILVLDLTATGDFLTIRIRLSCLSGISHSFFPICACCEFKGERTIAIVFAFFFTKYCNTLQNISILSQYPRTEPVSSFHVCLFYSRRSNFIDTAVGMNFFIFSLF